VNDRENIRLTRQRKVIIDALGSARWHPTAEELHALVRKTLPKISLGTVYRNLEILSVMGLARKLEFSGYPKRFESTRENHCHLRCLDCGRVEDTEVNQGINIEEIITANRGYRITGHRLEFLGICPLCKKETSLQ